MDDIRNGTLAGLKNVGVDPVEATATPGSLLAMQLKLAAAIEAVAVAVS